MIKSSDDPRPLHFVLVPFMAPGHMNPMVDLGKLLACRGVYVTIITTPQNSQRFKSTADRAHQTGLPLKFHSVEIFPENCENLDSVVSLEAISKFFEMANLLEEPLKIYLKESSPSCIVSDFIFSWSSKLAMELELPRFVFYSMSCFTLACVETLKEREGGRESEIDLKKSFIVPEIPHEIELNGEQTYVFVNSSEIDEANSTADGFVVNSCMDIETEYEEIYRTKKGRSIWTIGPVALCNTDMTDKSNRGLTSSSTSNATILSFLESMDPKSVVYVSFGSLSGTSATQMKELCLGLMDTGHPFVLVVRSKNNSMEIESWLENTQFEERNKKNGLVVRGWVPQVMILTHPSTGGFVTHCGWNSTLEGISAGVPMVTWPGFADQFLNERLVVDVLKTGVAVGAKERVLFWEEVLSVKRAKISMAIGELMGGEEEAVKRRKRASELSEIVNKAMDVGGSSVNNLNALIQQVTSIVDKKKPKSKS
ncbi:Flavonoid glucosyltransferase, family GT1 [Zostera marina]|uniref:Glycosyltransferase n=1 Tax=Zostera marina TaxID=29655 RepID=A0A0K9NLD6_ZOSMR|nr:Flavonoid glucosyltransferase, family GT1 [Zostera marina]